MELQRLSITGFKNYIQADYNFSGKINCFVGNNGVGKTNLLDAIHYLSFCKSFFNNLDTQNIHHGDEFFALHGTYQQDTGAIDLIQCVQRKNQRKKFLINRKEYERLADHIGLIPLVMISPYDRDLINDGSEIRRRYLDSVISQFDKFYLDDLIHYNKALFQRNALLKSFAEKQIFDAILLEPWDEQMIRLGEMIARKRQEFLEKFVPVFSKFYLLLSQGVENVNIQYVSQHSDNTYREAFKAAQVKDKIAQHSTMGVHRDDLEFMLDGFPIKKFGSQGQQKSFVIAIKLAQFEITCQIKGFKPILLLDDIFDKLDDLRVAQLIRMVNENNFGQVFITDTSRERITTIFETMDVEHEIFGL